MSESKKGNKHFLGKKHSEETKIKMGAWQVTIKTKLHLYTYKNKPSL